jgi:hypothetical protein
MVLKKRWHIEIWSEAYVVAVGKAWWGDGSRRRRWYRRVDGCDTKGLRGRRWLVGRSHAATSTCEST